MFNNIYIIKSLTNIYDKWNALFPSFMARNSFSFKTATLE
jgi:hypothetical protein